MSPTTSNVRETTITAMLLAQAILQKNPQIPLWRLEPLTQSEVIQVCSLVRAVLTPEEIGWFKTKLQQELNT